MRTFATLSAAVATVLVTTATAGLPAASAAAASPSLTITPGHGAYTGGSQLTLNGALGVTGRRAVIVQRHMGRTGDTWADIEGTRAWTREDGSFTVTAPASAMWALNYRVKAGSLTSPAEMTYAKAQEAILTQTTGASAGQPFTLAVDTVGARYTGYRDLPAPVLPGRAVTLQRRTSATTWTNVDASTLDGSGGATFTTTAPGSGTAWYRARLEDWAQDGDQIGWTTSHPVEVNVGSAAAARAFAPARTLAAAGTSAALPDLTSARSGERRHAADVYGWNRRARYSFDWEYGQSLSSPPNRGAALRGSWTEGSDGTGRATMRNGGLLFSSDGYGSAGKAGPVGDTWATQQGNSYRLGRWETRGSTTQRTYGKHDYRIRYELVPAGQSGRRCGTPGIVIAETSGPGSVVRFGVRGSNGRVWGGRARLDGQPGASSFAVQVTGKNITWFLNGTPVGTVRDTSVIPRRAMTVRISLVGRGRDRMNSAKSTVDWVRSYPLTYGKRATTRKQLRKGAAWGGC